MKQKEADLIINEAIFKDIAKVLKTLKDRGNNLGILTNNLESNVKIFLAKNNINVFDFIISQNNFLSKDILLKKILTERSLLANETVYIGDEDRDITASKSAGIKSVVVTWGFNSEKLLSSMKPDYLVRNPLELLSVK